MLNLWGRISSINVRKVVWCAQELGLDFQRTEAGGAHGLVHTPEYLAMNPNALVPLLQDGEGDARGQCGQPASGGYWRPRSCRGGACRARCGGGGGHPRRSRA